MTSFSYFYPSSWVLPIATLGLAAFIIGFRRFGKGCLLLALVLFLIRPVRILLLDFFPSWVAFVIGAVALLVALHGVLRMIFGDQVMKATTADLLARAISWAFRASIVAIKPLGLMLLPGGKLVVGAGILRNGVVDLLRSRGVCRMKTNPSVVAPVNDSSGVAQIEREDSNNQDPDECLEAGIILSGRVIKVEEHSSTVALLDGSLGCLPHSREEPVPMLNELVTCRVSDNSTRGLTHLVRV